MSDNRVEPTATADRRGKLQFLPLLTFIVAEVLWTQWLRIAGDLYDTTSRVSRGGSIGADFSFVYRAAVSITHGLRGYTDIPNYVYLPGVSVLYLPLAFFSQVTAYRIFNVILLAALVYITITTLRLSRIAATTGDLWKVLAIVLLVAFLADTYPVQFAFERGNFDLLAAAALVAALSLAQRSSVDWMGLAVGLAVVLKMYPVVIFAALIRRLSWRTVLWFSLSVALGTFCLGKTGVRHFLDTFSSIQYRPYFWVGNHSLASYFQSLGRPWEESGRYNLAILAFIGISAIVFYLVTFRRLGWFGRLSGKFCLAEIGIIGACFSAMSLVPATSHDYKLPIQFVPFALALGNYGRSVLVQRIEFATKIGLALSLAIMFSLLQSSPSTPTIIVNLGLYTVLIILGLIESARNPQPT
jgi:hypothetical protein